MYKKRYQLLISLYHDCVCNKDGFSEPQKFRPDKFKLYKDLGKTVCQKECIIIEEHYYEVRQQATSDNKNLEKKNLDYLKYIIFREH